MEKTNSSDVADNYSKSDLEYQYSPSKWSKRFGADEVIAEHIASVTAASKKAKERIPHEVMRYGKGKNQLIDLFGTSLPNDSPVLVYVHGGYWQLLDRSISAYVVEPLYKNGIRVAVVGYDLAPNAKLNEIVEEMKELDEFLTSWSIKTGAKDIWYAGHSAGAYLIAAILKIRGESKSLLTNAQIRGMIFISGVYHLLPLVDTTVNDQLKLTRDEAEKMSVTEINLKDLPGIKLLTVVAEHDSDEFRRQSLEFHEMLRRQNSNAAFVLIKEKDHFDVVEKLNDEENELMQMIINLIAAN